VGTGYRRSRQGRRSLQLSSCLQSYHIRRAALWVGPLSSLLFGWLPPSAWVDSLGTGKLPPPLLSAEPRAAQDRIIQSPDGMSRSPDGMILSPDKMILSLDGMDPAPDGTVPSPDGMPQSHDGMILSPDGTAPSPDGMILFHDEMEQAPDGMARSRQEITARRRNLLKSNP